MSSAYVAWGWVISTSDSSLAGSEALLGGSGDSTPLKCKLGQLSDMQHRPKRRVVTSDQINLSWVDQRVCRMFLYFYFCVCSPNPAPDVGFLFVEMGTLKFYDWLIARNLIIVFCCLLLETSLQKEHSYILYFWMVIKNNNLFVIFSTIPWDLLVWLLLAFCFLS